MTTLDDLLVKTDGELLAIAEGLGLGAGENMDDLRLRILEVTGQQTLMTRKEEPKEKKRGPKPKEKDEIVEALVNADPDHPLIKALSKHIAHGLVVTFPDPQTWHIRFNNKEDSGNINQPVKNIVLCAQSLLRIAG